MHDNTRQKDFFWGALVGGALATLSALFFTTKKGKEIQRQIVGAYDDLEDSAKETLDSSKEKLARTTEQAGKKLAHKIDPEHHSKDSHHKS